MHLALIIFVKETVLRIERFHFTPFVEQDPKSKILVLIIKDLYYCIGYESNRKMFFIS